MRKLFSIINLFLCFELIVGPLAPQMSFFANQALAQENCPQGLSRDPITNRCITSAQTAAILNATSSCATDDHACFKRNAEEALQGEANKNENLEFKDHTWVSSVTNAAALTGAITIGMSILSAPNKCQATSKVLMTGAAVAVVAGELIANGAHRKRLKNIRDDWGSIVNPEAANGDKDLQREASINAQSLAFGKLAESEDSLVKAAKLKKTIYLAAGIAFAAAGVIALLENVKGGGLASICNPEEAKKNEMEKIIKESPTSHETFPNSRQGFMYNLKNSKNFASFIMNKRAMELVDRSPTIDEYEMLQKTLSHTDLDKPEIFSVIKEISLTVMNNLSPIQNSYADSNAAKAFKEDEGKKFDWAGVGSGVALGAAIQFVPQKHLKAIKKALVSSTGRAIYAGVMSTSSYLMSRHAASQAKASENRAKHLRKMQDDFITASGSINACKSADRNDPGKPQCYCYTPENTRNPNRTNSSVCNALFNGSMADSGNYYQDGSGDRICVTNTNQADPACACKKTKSCMKVNLSGIKGLNMGTMSMLGQAVSPLNSLMNGGSAASVDAGLSGSLAANLNKLQKQLEANPALKDFAKTKEKNSKGLLQELTKASASIPSSSLLGSSGGAGMPSNAGEAARMLEKELEPQVPTKVGGTETAAVPSNDSAPNFEFGLTEDQLAAQGDQLAEVMKADLEYGANDINQGSKTNIFEVLSNRYQRSGMRRLFDEKGVTTPEKAATTDINQ